MRAAGVEPILIAPSTFHYSGLATGVLSGALAAGRGQINVAALAAHFGVRHIAAEVTQVERPCRRLHLSDGQVLSYDAVSFNVGSVTRDPDGLADGVDVWPTKPLTGLIDLRSRVEAYIENHGEGPAIIVVGSGQSGFEIAAALAGLVQRHGATPDIQLLCKSSPTWAPPRAIARLSGALQHRGVVIVHGQIAEYGSRDMLVLASGLTAVPIIAALGLPIADHGRLRVGPTLQSMADPTVFAVGDCSVVDGAPRPAAGVFGVRAAPVLLHNLAALGHGGSMRRYQPQRHWLSIMDLGDGNGLAIRGRFWWMGPAALALKRRLDLGFIDRMRAPSGDMLQD